MAVAYTPTRFSQASMNAVPTIVYTAPSGGVALGIIIKQLIVVNYVAATVPVYVSLVPFGQVDGVGYRILHNVDVPAKSVLTFELSQVVNPGGFIVAYAAVVNALTLHASGLVMSDA